MRIAGTSHCNVRASNSCFVQGDKCFSHRRGHEHPRPTSGISGLVNNLHNKLSVCTANVSIWETSQRNNLIWCRLSFNKGRRDDSSFRGFSTIFDSRIFEFRLLSCPINFAIFSTITLFNSRKLKILKFDSMAIQFYVVSRYLENRISVGNKNNAPTKR